MEVEKTKRILVVVLLVALVVGMAWAYDTIYNGEIVISHSLKINAGKDYRVVSFSECQNYITCDNASCCALHYTRNVESKLFFLNQYCTPLADKGEFCSPNCSSFKGIVSYRYEPPCVMKCYCKEPYVCDYVKDGGSSYGPFCMDPKM